MSGQPDFDGDADAAMRQMMGFGTFTERRKNNPPDTSFASSSAASQPGGSSNEPTTSIGPTSLITPQHASQQVPQTQGQGDEEPIYAFSSPVSNTYYTKEDLDRWARGMINANGDTVYFKPGFVSNDPWARLRPREENDNKTAGA
ncbi:uncharacterized protein PV06_02558 [Exophiala oligosperma]|uniref:Uncharacterized protein n=1 Tax=Exophiala oligosperma TaxID=215243 RepID=A0A0D2DV16_9EURO|nr:uncharacterized protein PV06_02558 [Exophiala oligosperma]KIW46938.1 hypothetical protein PV06_02558 [Exophiala oligosperma]